ncbi:hypothetical protein PU560_01750, partial [Georgenia sp. 10Sc9-8]|nr:hypothetical protein [Georgenia halotolerans]
LRAARLDGADLSAALFVTQSQLEAARGDHRTMVPAFLRRPLHWSTVPSTSASRAGAGRSSNRLAGRGLPHQPAGNGRPSS